MRLHLRTLFRAHLQDLKYTLWFPIYLLIFSFLEQRSIGQPYWATQLPMDDWIPFCDWFILPYCLWYPLLIGLGVFLLVRDTHSFRRYMGFLAFTFFVSELIWFLIPNGQDLRPALLPQGALLPRLVTALYRIDTNTNVFPSVHVSGSMGAAFAAWDSPPIRQKKWVCAAITILCGMICLSVVLIKQHSILDLLGGLLLSLVAAWFIY